jgi:uncharacterized protein
MFAIKLFCVVLCLTAMPLMGVQASWDNNSPENSPQHSLMDSAKVSATEGLPTQALLPPGTVTPGNVTQAIVTERMATQDLTTAPLKATTANPVALAATTGLDIINTPPPIKPTGWDRFVVDYAHVLAPAEKQRYTQLLAPLDKQGQSQLSVVILPNTDRELSELAPAWFNAWGIGHGERDDGILVLVNQARVRTGQSGNRIFVAVGSGVQGTLPDGRVGELIRTFARPGLNQGNTAMALDGLLPELVNILSTEPITADKGTGTLGDWPIILAVVLFVLFMHWLQRRRYGGTWQSRGDASPWVGGWTAGGGSWGSGGGFGDGGGGWSGGSFGGGSSDGGGAG